MTQMRPGGKVDGMKSGLVKDDFRKQSPVGSTDRSNMEREGGRLHDDPRTEPLERLSCIEGDGETVGTQVGG